jgi:hypothetical protein
MERAFLEKPATAGGHGHRARLRLGNSGVSTREKEHLHRSFTHSSRSFSESAQSTYLLQVNGGGCYERWTDLRLLALPLRLDGTAKI